jgi:hypothetical protein
MMADKETAALTAAAAFGAGDLFHIVQGGNSRKGTPAQMATFVDSKALRDLVASANGAKIGIEVRSEELTLAGASVTSTIVMPDRSIVLGVGSRVTLAITGAPSFGVGISGEATKFGGTLGVTLGSSNVGIIGPSAIYADTPIIITPTSGTFSSGKVRVSAYFLTFTAPTS